MRMYERTPPRTHSSKDTPLQTCFCSPALVCPGHGHPSGVLSLWHGHCTSGTAPVTDIWSNGTHAEPLREDRLAEHGLPHLAVSAGLPNQSEARQQLLYTDGYAQKSSLHLPDLGQSAISCPCSKLMEHPVYA
eukprot:scaffold83875_cov28-Tisochrysis_lutea.AAC.1